MVFEISVEDTFCASHYLTGVGGPEAALHGHDFRVTAVFTTDSISDSALGMVAHDRDMKKLLHKVLSPMNYTCLNDLEQFEGVSPTLEFIATLILVSLREVKPPHMRVVSVSVQSEDHYIVKCVDNFKLAT